MSLPTAYKCSGGLEYPTGKKISDLRDRYDTKKKKKKDAKSRKSGTGLLDFYCDTSTDGNGRGQNDLATFSKHRVTLTHLCHLTLEVP